MWPAEGRSSVIEVIEPYGKGFFAGGPDELGRRVHGAFVLVGLEAAARLFFVSVPPA